MLGFDVQRRMAEGTRKNLGHFGVVAEGVVVADSRRLPLTHVDRVVSDPPYGKSASTLGIVGVGEALGYRHVESHFAYVHGTLTREIAVFEKV